LETASQDAEVAYSAYDALHKPFHRAQADNLLAQFFERRHERDQAILVRARAGDRRRLAGIIGTDYPLLRRTFRSEEEVMSVGFSPDGNLLAVGDDKNAHVFETVTGKEIASFARLNVFSVSFSPDGRLLGTSSWQNRNALLFDIATRREVFRFPHQGHVHRVAFSPDGKLLATGGDDMTAHLFDTVRGMELARFHHDGPVWGLAFSHDGRFLATGSADDFARVFEIATRREVLRRQHGDIVYSVAFGPDNRLATASQDQTARLMDVATGNGIVAAFGGRLYAIACSPDGKVIITGASDASARLFEAATGREMFRLFHERAVWGVAFSPDGRWVSTASVDKTARIFDVPTGVPKSTRRTRISAVAFSANGKLLATRSPEHTVQVSDPATGLEISRFSVDGSAPLAFSEDGKMVVAGPRIFDSVTGREVARLSIGKDVSAVAFSPNGLFVVAASGSDVAAFETDTRKEVSRLARQDKSVSAVAVSSDGKLLGTAESDDAVHVFEARTGQEISRIPSAKSVASVAFSPDASLLVTETGNWLHLCQRAGNNWRPIANRFLPVIWSGTVRFLPDSAHCKRCVEVARDVPENQIKLDRIDFAEFPPPVQGDPQHLVAEWSARFGLTFDARGHIVPLQP
jgi:WD40 repeat protein